MDSSKANFATGEEGNESSLIYINVYVQIYTEIYIYVVCTSWSLASSSFQNAPKGFEMLLFDVWVKAITYGEMLSVLTQPAP